MKVFNVTALLYNLNNDNWETIEEVNMPFWKRALITLVAMLAVSFVIGSIWRSLFGFGLPDYASGVVGGLTAIPLWEFLKRVELTTTL